MKTDISTIHLIIRGAILIAILSLLASLGLGLFSTWREGAIALIGVPGACVTGLFGLLARTRTDPPTGDQPLPVQVQQPADQPVPVQEADTTAGDTGKETNP